MITPRYVTDAKSFFGLYNVFRLFVPQLAKITFPIKDAFEKNDSFNLKLNEKKPKAIISVQQKQISPPVEALPFVEGRMTLDTDG